MPTVDDVPPTVRAKAIVAGAADWLAGLRGLVDDLATRWSLRVGPAFTSSTEAYVVPVDQADGTPAVLKLIVPRDGDHARHEITVLRLAEGDGCARLLDADEGLGALLLERLGPSMADLTLALGERHELLCAAARALWRPAPDAGLPTGAAKGRWLVDHIERLWEALDRPCSTRVVDHARTCAERRVAAHDDERAVLVHGDVHQWNALRAGDGFKLVDPDGLLAEAEYDLGIIMREDPVELLADDPWARARMLAARTGRDVVAAWEWGVVERVSTGLLCRQIGLEPVGTQMLVAAEHCAVVPG